MQVTFLPLEGVRVVDVTTSLAGPYCTEVLAALGADVVKVEPPTAGDEARSWGPPFWNGESTMFLAMNAGKRSVALDLRRGLDVVLRLADGADVFIQSLRPGTAEARGFGADAVRVRNPRLVYATIGAFGREGPWSDRPGYDPLAQAAGGILSVTGEEGGPGVRVGVSMIDQSTGLWAALGIVSALHERERTGEGRTIDVSLYETALALLSYQLTGFLSSGTVPGRHGTAFPSIVPYRVYATADGEMMIAAGNDGLFAALAEALGIPKAAEDPRFRTNPDRVAHRRELDELVGAAVSGLRDRRAAGPARGGGRAGRAGARHRASRRASTDEGARHAAIAPAPSRPRAGDGRDAVLRGRRASATPDSSSGARRPHGRRARGGRFHGRGDRRSRPPRSR